jgi:hypothetical protein
MECGGIAFIAGSRAGYAQGIGFWEAFIGPGVQPARQQKTLHTRSEQGKCLRC